MEIERIDPFVALNLLAQIGEWKTTPDMWFRLSTQEVCEAVEPLLLLWMEAHGAKVTVPA